MANWTSTQDVLDRWVGSNLPTDTELIETLIADAEIVVKSIYPRIQERIDTSSLSLDVVKFVVARMVIRMLRNPESISATSRSVGPFSESRTFGSEKDIWLTDSEKAMLAPTNGRRASSIDILSGSQKVYRQYTWDDNDVQKYVEDDVEGITFGGHHAVDPNNALEDYNHILEENEDLN